MPSRIDIQFVNSRLPRLMLGAIFFTTLALLAGGVAASRAAEPEIRAYCVLFIPLALLVVIQFINRWVNYRELIGFSEESEIPIPMHGAPTKTPVVIRGEMAFPFLPTMFTGRHKALLVQFDSQLGVVPGRIIRISGMNFAATYWFWLLIPGCGVLVFVAMAAVVAIFSCIASLANVKGYRSLLKTGVFDPESLESGISPVSLAENPIIRHDADRRRIYVRWSNQRICHCFRYSRREAAAVKTFMERYRQGVAHAYAAQQIIACSNCFRPVFETSRQCVYCGVEADASGECFDFCLVEFHSGDDLPAICYQCGLAVSKDDVRPYENQDVRSSREAARNSMKYSLASAFRVIPVVGGFLAFVVKAMLRRRSEALQEKRPLAERLQQWRVMSVLPQCDYCLIEFGLPTPETPDHPDRYYVHRDFADAVISANRADSMTAKKLAALDAAAEQST